MWANSFIWSLQVRMLAHERRTSVRVCVRYWWGQGVCMCQHNVGLLISHLTALVHRQRCHVAEQIPALMDECSFPPTQRAPLLPLQRFLRRISLHTHFLKNLSVPRSVLCFSKDVAIPMLVLVGIIINPYKPAGPVLMCHLWEAWTLRPNWRSQLDSWWMSISFLFLVSVCSVLYSWHFFCRASLLSLCKDFLQVLQLPHTHLIT